MTVDLSAIPAELRDRAQWVAYRLEQRGGKVTKVPYTFSGAPASSTDRATWGTFDDAVRACANGFSGAGFTFAADGPYLGVDLDGVRDPVSGAIEPEAQRIIDRLASYTEISQSGRGAHIIVAARKPGRRARVGHLEMYDEGRYFVMTGRHLDGTPTTIEERQGEIDVLYAEMFPPASPPTNGSRPPGRVDVDDAELLRRMFAAKNGATIERLWRGDASAYPSASEGDSALCCHLAFWTDRDAARIDALFRQSGLYREKWDSRRGETTYGAQTIEHAVAMVREGYSNGPGSDTAAKRGRTMAQEARAASRSTYNTPSDAGISQRPRVVTRRVTTVVPDGAIDPEIEKQLSDGVGQFAGRAARALTDLGNAERLVDRHGEDLRYVATTKEWYAFDGRRWQVDATGEIDRRAKDTARSILGEAEQADDPRHRRELAIHALKSESASRIEAMIGRARSEARVAIRADALDSHPWAFNAANATIDLRTGAPRPHDRDDLITKLSVKYDPTATCPQWLAFLDRVMAQDAELIAFVRRWIGYTLTGDTSEQKLVLFYGTGANGKSTLLETMRAVLGDYARHADFATFLAQRGDSIRNDVARLRGARLVTASEMQGGRALDESLIKQVTGGDVVTARKLYSESFEFIPKFKLILATNHKPVIRGTDHAIWRRILMVPFRVTIPADEQDPHLRDKLAGELDGILAWAVQGCVEWQRGGLNPPATVLSATETYRTEMDTLGDFLEERCVVEAEATVTAKAVYTAYQEWAASSGEKPMAQNAFGMRLSERGFERGRGAARATRQNLWRGIRLATDQPLDLGGAT